MKLTDLTNRGGVTPGGEVKVTHAYDMSGLLCTHNTEAIGLESATSQHSNNFKNSKTGSTWIQFLYGSKHISSGLTHSMVMLPVKLTDLATGGGVTTGGEIKVTPSCDMSGLLCTHILRQ